MKNLINQLKKETQGLKKEYIQKTESWSDRYYKLVMAKLSWKDEDWCNHLGVTPEIHNAGRVSEFKGFPKGFFNTEKSRTLHRMQSEVDKLYRMGVQEFKRRAVVEAESHYESSILKLADRLVKKGLNTESISIIYSQIGVNIEITITDNKKTVRAWTIIAEGPVQRPHYRYLVK